MPTNIIWRTKEAFSDGVSGNAGSWFEINTNKLNNKLFLDKNNITHNKPITNEQKYYRELYESYYPNTSNVIPYFWMPKFIKANDSSARTLDIYKKRNNIK